VSEEEYIRAHRGVLESYWHSIALEILSWKACYEWPKGMKLEEAIRRRNALESDLARDLKEHGYISQRVFDDVMVWGFGKPSGLREEDISAATEKAFASLKDGDLYDAALQLTLWAGFGIARASKVLALSDQKRFGIYDSRSADGLSDLCQEGKRVIPIPPGRVIRGDSLTKREFCVAFREYTWVLRFLHCCAQQDKKMRDEFQQVADIEIALFARSRKRSRPSAGKARSLDTIPDIEGQTDESNCYVTLGMGNKAKKFWGDISEDGIVLWTGSKGKTVFRLNAVELESCLAYFTGHEWFPLGNRVDAVERGGLGEYFQDILRQSPLFASHVAAILVNQSRLEYRYGVRNRIELKVID
jgi:hypothetical protein